MTAAASLCDEWMTVRLVGVLRWCAEAMRNETSLRVFPARRRRLAIVAAVVLIAVGAGGALTGCGNAEGGSEAKPGSSSPASQDKTGKKVPAPQDKTGKKVLWLGDSIAAVEAPPLSAALQASGVEFKNASSDGGGTVVRGDKMIDPIAAATWKDLGADLASFHPNVIAYQITTYDWGTLQQQRASYEKLAKTAQDAGAELVIVSAPPYKLDDFYKKHEGAIKSAPKAAEKVAVDSGGKVRFFDSSALWGVDSTAAKAHRSSDGIHSCQQGSAAFAKWFTEQLGKAHGFTPAAPGQWAKGSWVADKRYAKLGCR
jgi:hypothetical protein